MTESRPPHKVSHGPLFLAIRWAAAAVVLGILFHFLPLDPLRNALAHVPPTRFIAVLIAYFLALTVGTAKWRMVVNTAGAQLSFRDSAQCFSSGLFGDLFLPSVIGGDIARLAVGISRSRRPAAVITGNVADRILDAAAQVSLILLGLVLLPGSLPVPLQIPARRVLFAVALGTTLVLVLVAALHRLLFRGRSRRFRRRLAQLRHSLRSISRRPHRLIFGWMLGVAIQGSYIILTSFIAVSCGLKLPLRVWLFGWPLAKIASVLPVTQGGIGVREAALVLLLVPFGASSSLVFATGIAWEGIIIAGGLIAGLTALLLQRYQAASARP